MSKKAHGLNLIYQSGDYMRVIELVGPKAQGKMSIINEGKDPEETKEIVTKIAGMKESTVHI